MLRVIGTFIVAALIIYASYLASKYIGKGLGRGVSSRYMRLIRSEERRVGKECM